jgi:hypothetical protein
MMGKVDEIQGIIDGYNKVVGSIDTRATNAENGRAYGGIIRAGKGKLVETIAKVLVQLAWEKIHQNPNRLGIIGRQIKIPIKNEYIDKLKDEKVKRYITQNIENYYYPCKPDVLVSIDNKIVLEIECKSYTENAMLKRILVDASLLKTQYPNMQFILLQLESQLGGDFSELKEITFGSPSTHTILSYFDIELYIITLLEGERKVERPIHKAEFFKPLRRENVEKATIVISERLKEYI